jgi:glycosyltransferase involved in cell wall biosynthesis
MLPKMKECESDLMPAISVLLPVHNGDRYLRVAVESVLTQTFSDFELLALDDGSTDSSLSILHELEASDARMHVLSRKKRGLVATLNELIATSRGQYLARMDADDLSRPPRFERQIAYLEAHPECVAVGSRALLIDPEGMPIVETRNELDHVGIDNAFLSGLSAFRGILHPTAMMRKYAVLKIGSYRDEYQSAEDMDLFLRLAEVGDLANVPEVLYEYRQHLGSVGYSRRDQQANATFQAARMAWSRRGIPGKPEEPRSRKIVQTDADAHRKWVWWALSAGHVATARKHALKAVTMNPFNFENVRALACAIRGR